MQQLQVVHDYYSCNSLMVWKEIIFKANIRALVRKGTQLQYIRVLLSIKAPHDSVSAIQSRNISSVISLLPACCEPSLGCMLGLAWCCYSEASELGLSSRLYLFKDSYSKWTEECEPHQTACRIRKRERESMHVCVWERCEPTKSLSLQCAVQIRFIR